MTSNSLTPANVERREALDRLLLLIEQQLPGVRASVLVLDDDGVTLHHGSAPHLPAEYSAAIDGLQIGPKAGSCGTAIFRQKAVIVEDIANDPLWEDYRDFALPHGLRACWSTPICDDANKILGSFAMYYDIPRLPTPPERSLAKTATLLASHIIARARLEAQASGDEAGPTSGKVEDVRITDVIESARSRIAHRLAEKRITFKCEGCDDIELRCDPEKTSQILFTAMSNAANATPPDGLITVSVTKKEGRGCITVHDSSNEGAEFILTLPLADK